VPGSPLSLPSSSDVSPTVFGYLSYTWEFYLPKLPHMRDWFTYNPVRDTWIDGFIGNFGWLDYGFPRWVYNVVPFLYLALIALFVRELLGRRPQLKARAGEIVTYVGLALGVVLFVHAASYVGQLSNPGGFEQARYLFPLLALYGALIALAARGAGRWGPAVGVFLVCLAIAHTAVAMLLTLTRYYG
jgi:uncharacterized membrane protein